MNITDTLREGATYAGHPFHIVLNYSVLLLVLVPHFFLFQRRSWGWLIIFLLFTIIQVGLWFTNGAVGISLIWCGLAGYNLLLFFQYRKEGRVMAFMLLFSPLVALGAMVFYYLHFPIATSSACIRFSLRIGAGFSRTAKTKENSIRIIFDGRLSVPHKLFPT